MTESENHTDNPPSSPDESSHKVVPASVKKTSVSFTGPLPPPNLLAGYNNIVPGAAERIIAIAEGEAVHQRDMERLVTEHMFAERKRGQTFALFIAVVALGASAFLGYNGHEVVAGVIGGTTICSLVATFAFGRLTQDPS